MTAANLLSGLTAAFAAALLTAYVILLSRFLAARDSNPEAGHDD